MNHSIIASVLTVTILTDDSSLLMQISRLWRTLRFTNDFWLQKSETMSTKLVSEIHPRTYPILLVKKKYSNIYSSHSKLISSGNSLLQFIDTYRYTPYFFNTSTLHRGERHPIIQEYASIKGLQHSSPNTAGDPEPLFKTMSTSF